MLYLLHIEETDNTIWHYAGITTERRIWDRFIEHHNRVDRDGIAQAVARGAKVTINTLAEEATTLTERTIIAMGETAVSKNLCPECGAPRQPGMHHYNNRRRREGINQRPARQVRNEQASK
jgi:hypothetical protein